MEHPQATEFAVNNLKTWLRTSFEIQITLKKDFLVKFKLQKFSNVFRFFYCNFTFWFLTYSRLKLQLLSSFHFNFASKPSTKGEN